MLAESLLQLALKAGVREEIEEESLQVFVHGTTKHRVHELVSQQGGCLSASAGNFGGRFFAALDRKVAQEFAERTAGRVKGEDEPALVGIALPSSVAGKLTANGLLKIRPFDDRPGLQAIFEPAAMATVKNEGFFFSI